MEDFLDTGAHPGSAQCPCPLCHTTHAALFHEDRHRPYYRCHTCLLVFVPSAYFLSPVDEKAVYDLHENAVDDPGYRRFLSRLFEPMYNHLAPNSTGLDFGCGPAPALATMFQEAGHLMDLYDHFYYPDADRLQQPYDFITASEVVEHLHHPRPELDRLWSCLKPSGILGIMTKRVLNQAAFARWHYITDPTHVCFFSTDTFQWLANQWQADLTVIGNDVVLLTKRQ